MINKLKSYGRLINWCRGVVYDFVRFYKYGGWKINLDDKSAKLLCSKGLSWVRKEFEFY